MLKSKFTGDNETGGEETDSKKRHRRGKKWEGNKKERKQNHKKGKGRSKTPENSGAKNKKQDKLGSHQDVPYTSIVPYHHSGANSKEDEEESSYAFDNEVLHANSISELSEWDELSVDSVSL